MDDRRGAPRRPPPRATTAPHLGAFSLLLTLVALHATFCLHVCMSKNQKVGVAPIEDKMRESRLQWFGHVRRDRVMHVSDVLRCVEKRQRREGDRGRPKQT
ncbi:unnamed protein product [Cuscuta epithymum]|uniref:Uncharacterized protein n=1 Tax=Cuscuta epithymum TaxID=186058 RepID=A0AAV0F112_9ASTE|nr:unnamed protein product [Cuscuta epithymum]